MNNLFRDKLQNLIKQYGLIICNDPKKFKGLLRDLFPEYKREVNIIIAALKEKIVVNLMNISENIPTEIQMSNLTQRLYDNLGMAEEFARWAVESWALILGVTYNVKPQISKQVKPQLSSVQTSQPCRGHKFKIDITWWNQLEDERWKQILTKAIGIIFEPNSNDLNKIFNLNKLDCSLTQISSLEPLRYFNNLQFLSCWGNQINSLEPLQHLRNLQSLHCSENQITSLEPLRYFTNLQSLYCFDNKINSLEPLRDLINLQSLSCWGNEISQLEPLFKLKNLQYLNCKNTRLSLYEIKKFKKAVPQCEVTYG